MQDMDSMVYFFYYVKNIGLLNPFPRDGASLH